LQKAEVGLVTRAEQHSVRLVGQHHRPLDQRSSRVETAAIRPTPLVLVDLAEEVAVVQRDPTALVQTEPPQHLLLAEMADRAITPTVALAELELRLVMVATALLVQNMTLVMVLVVVVAVGAM